MKWKYLVYLFPIFVAYIFFYSTFNYIYIQRNYDTTYAEFVGNYTEEVIYRKDDIDLDVINFSYNYKDEEGLAHSSSWQVAREDFWFPDNINRSLRIYYQGGNSYPEDFIDDQVRADLEISFWNITSWLGKIAFTTIIFLVFRAGVNGKLN